jgi:hypothetical protein
MNENDTLDLTDASWGEEIIFTYSFADSDGEKTHANVIGRFYPHGGTVGAVAAQFRSFLIASGFDYVANVKVITDKGDEIYAD